VVQLATECSCLGIHTYWKRYALLPGVGKPESYHPPFYGVAFGFDWIDRDVLRIHAFDEYVADGISELEEMLANETRVEELAVA